jgi:anti-sigma factor RsiW
MRCKKVKKNLTAFLDGELPTRLGQRMEEHLASCADCETDRNALERLRSALEGMEAPAICSSVSAEAILARAGFDPRDVRALPEKRQEGRDMRSWPSLIIGLRPAVVLATVLVAIGLWRVYPFLKSLPLPTHQEIYMVERMELFEDLELIKDLSLVEGLGAEEGRNGELS